MVNSVILFPVQMGNISLVKSDSLCLLLELASCSAFYIYIFLFLLLFKYKAEHVVTFREL